MKKVLLSVVLLLAIFTASARADSIDPVALLMSGMYTYPGPKVFSQQVTLRLDSATLPRDTSVAAVWLGVNDSRYNFIQAGIIYNRFLGQPYLYVETNRSASPLHTLTRLDPVALGQTVTVTLVRDGITWSEFVNGQKVGSADLTFSIVTPPYASEESYDSAKIKAAIYRVVPQVQSKTLHGNLD